MPWTTATATFVGWRPREWPLWGEMGCNLLLAALLEGLNRLGSARAHTTSVTLWSRGRKLGPILRPLLAALKQSEPEVAVPPAAYTALSRLRELS
jgi:hypothetical protein